MVKNAAFERYCNLDQSLFARFIKLGVPTVLLDRQGRCRPSISQLFAWSEEKKIYSCFFFFKKKKKKKNRKIGDILDWEICLTRQTRVCKKKRKKKRIVDINLPF